MANIWTDSEVEAIVKDYFDMFICELQGKPYNKSKHRQKLSEQLNNRSHGSIERKHQNISAVLIEQRLPYISGYKPLRNYQRTLLPEAIESSLRENPRILELISEDVNAHITVPSVDDILKALVPPPQPSVQPSILKEGISKRPARTSMNYLSLEAANTMLGNLGEQFVMNYEQARLIYLGKEKLAGRLEQVSVTVGDSAGYDIHSYEESGNDRFIEVKTTKYGKETPFFITANELGFSESFENHYHLYRVFNFRSKPKLFTLQGFIESTCHLSPVSYLAQI
ncbi:MAG: DUF3883 domain-containing protein [bacterium]|nr:DUF3883 domain-containing protein [bacterium]